MSMPGLTAISPTPPIPRSDDSAGLPKPETIAILPPTMSFACSTERIDPPNSVAMSRL
jgi:hypothetical protein